MQQWKAFGETVFNLTILGIEPKTSHIDSDIYNVYADQRLLNPAKKFPLHFIVLTFVNVCNIKIAKYI